MSDFLSTRRCIWVSVTSCFFFSVCKRSPPALSKMTAGSLQSFAYGTSTSNRAKKSPMSPCAQHHSGGFRKVRLKSKAINLFLVTRAVYQVYLALSNELHDFLMTVVEKGLSKKRTQKGQCGNADANDLKRSRHVVLGLYWQPRNWRRLKLLQPMAVCFSLHLSIRVKNQSKALRNHWNEATVAFEKGFKNFFRPLEATL